MKSIIKGVRIGAVSAAVPDNWVSLTDQFAVDEAEAKTVKKFIKSTGVTGRYLAGPRQTTSDLCFAAAKQILDSLGIDKSQIGTLVLVTQTEDYRSPASATVLQYRLGLSQACIAFDVNLGCSGYTCGLNIAGSLLMQSSAKYALLLCGDTSAREKDPNDALFSSNADKMLFGDSGTATLLVRDEDAPDINVLSASDGSGFKTIMTPYEWYRNPVRSDPATIMDGIGVFNFSTEEAPKMICRLMSELGSSPDDYDHLVLHQANKLIIDRIGKATGFDKDKNLSSIATFGNTSSGSIPDTLVDHYGSDQSGELLHCILCGFGVGLSWSAVDCYIAKNVILPLVKTNDYFDDGMHVG